MIDLTIIREILIKHVPFDIAILIIKCTYVDKNTSFVFRVNKIKNCYEYIIDDNFNDVDIMLYICDYIDITQHNMDTWDNDKIFIDDEFLTGLIYTEQRIVVRNKRGYRVESKSEIIGYLLIYMMRIICDEDSGNYMYVGCIYDVLIKNNMVMSSYNMLEIINIIVKYTKENLNIYIEGINQDNEKIDEYYWNIIPKIWGIDKVIDYM